MKTRILISLLMLWSCSMYQVNSAAVMSVDFGSEWMKVGVVSPGVPMEIALNKESKRKTPAVVAFRDGERTFGEDATTVGIRFPKNSYGYLLDLIGKSTDHPLVQRYLQIFPYYEVTSDPERGTPIFKHDDEKQFTPEELVAQLLTKARDFAQISTGQIITECIITVPGFFNQIERRSMIEAARLADLKVLQLINDHAAIALNYGIFRRKEMNDTAQYIAFYDMGARSTKVSIVEYKNVKTKEKGFVETNPQLHVLGYAFDRTLGGLEITLRLRDHLGKKFNEMKKTTNDVFKNPRAMAKLMKEANRVKTVLSANADHYAQVEGLLDDKDFRVQVTREELEAMCKDLLERVTEPLNAALKNAGLTLDVINQVVLVGASTRIPKLQEVLQATIGSDLGKNINTDEAAALGAVYRAADLSIGFKVKKFIVKDAVVFPIQVLFERNHEGNIKQVKRTLFGAMNPYPQKKVITFNKHTSDFDFFVNYAELDHIPPSEVSSLGSLNITKVTLKGVKELLEKSQGPNIESKGIKAHFAMDDSGILYLTNVDMVTEKTISPEEQQQEESSFAKLGSTISKLFGSDSSAEKTKVETETESPEVDEQTDKPIPNTTSNANETQSEQGSDNSTQTESEPLKPKIVTLKEPVEIVASIISVPPLTEDQYTASYNKIAALNKFDQERTRRETALNNLEAFVIDAQLKLETEEYSSCGITEEIENILKACKEAADWLYEDGSDASALDYENRLDDLKKLTNNIYAKHWEHNGRADALNALTGILNSSQHFLTKAKNLTKETNPDMDVFTEVEISVLQKVIVETKKWKKEMLAEQAKLKRHEEVKLTVKSIVDKMADLDREIKYLTNKMKIWRPKVTPPPVNVTKSENGTSENAEPVIEEPPLVDIPVEEEQNDEDDSSSKIPIETISEPTTESTSDPDEHNEL